jgi:hypothetical protein
MIDANIIYLLLRDLFMIDLLKVRIGYETVHQEEAAAYTIQRSYKEHSRCVRALLL